MTESHFSTFTASSSAWHQSTIDGAGIPKETFIDRLKETREWIWSSDRGLLMGRSPQDWLMYIVSYLLLWGFLVFMSAVFCGLFYWRVERNEPTHSGPDSILQVPGLAFRPQPYVQSTLIRFRKNDPTTYSHHIDHIDAYLNYYENKLQQGDNFRDCSSIKSRRSPEDIDKACVFDIKDLGKSCVKQQVFGFSDGQPCILLKLNKVYDWVPEEYTADTVPDEIRAAWSRDPWSIHLKCEGEDAVTRENMGDLVYYPSGFPFKYYPFRNQQGFRSPLAFLRFDNPVPGVLLMMSCKAYARNIVHNRTEMMGQVHFELMVD